MKARTMDYVPPEISNHPAFIKMASDLEAMRSRYEAAKIVIEQQTGEARRKWPGGRTSADDDGQLAFAISHDEKTGEVAFEFGKPVGWFSMSPQTAIDVSLNLYEVANKILHPEDEQS